MKKLNNVLNDYSQSKKFTVGQTKVVNNIQLAIVSLGFGERLINVSNEQCIIDLMRDSLIDFYCETSNDIQHLRSIIEPLVAIEMNQLDISDLFASTDSPRSLGITSIPEAEAPSAIRPRRELFFTNGNEDVCREVVRELLPMLVTPCPGQR